MNWNDFVGHERQRRWFENAIRKNRLASTFLLVGPPQIGKRTFARLVAKTLFCRRRTPGGVEICGRCESCVQVDADTHPDLLTVEKEQGSSRVTIEQLVGSVENRLREGLAYEIHLKPYYGDRRIAIIDDADTFGAEQANCMLKTLEEPPAGSLIFLISQNEHRQLPTIRSRAQAVRFGRLSDEELQRLILRLGWSDDPAEAAALAAKSGGTLATAQQLRDPAVADFLKQFAVLLDLSPLPIVRLSALVESLVKTASEDTHAKREVLAIALQTAIDRFRPHLIQAAHRPGAKPPHPLVTAEAIALSLEAQSLVERNVNVSSVIEAWLAGLARAVDSAAARSA